ncbi:MAG: hypothetical protein HPY59_12395, partial [Anaerolineae bacterium]|nr:hypothetical protein [Anaerolineae bacterium]
VVRSPAAGTLNAVGRGAVRGSGMGLKAAGRPEPSYHSLGSDGDSSGASSLFKKL